MDSVKEVLGGSSLGALFARAVSWGTAALAAVENRHRITCRDAQFKTASNFIVSITSSVESK
jgi:hypothetical protein